MKKIIFFLLAFSGFYGCKRKWTDKDKSEFVSGCLNKMIKEMGESKAKSYCNCLMDKIVKKYPNANDVKYIKYDSSVTHMAKDCLKQH